MNDAAGIKRRFGKSAQTYDHYAEIQDRVAHSLINQIDETSPNTILEIGCGTGLLSTQIIKKFPDARITFTDLSPDMLAIAENKIKTRYQEKQNQVSFHTFNPETDTLENKYDLILSSMAVHWFNNIESAISSLQSALENNGTFYYSTIGQDCFIEWKSILETLNLANGLRIPNELKGVEKTEAIKVNYGSAQNFLKNLKLTGAHSPKPGYNPLSPKQLKSAMSILEQKYQATLTWQIIYAKCKEQS